MLAKSTAVAAAGLSLSAPAFALAQSAVQQPTLTAEQATQLFAEAGFGAQDGRPVNRCGAPARPRVGFVDLDEDGRAEAHIADVAPACYGKPGAYFAILGRQADGSWKRLIAEDGIVGFERTRSSGWNDLSLDPRDSGCPGVRRFNGADYGAPTACGTFATDTSTSAPARTPGDAPLSQQELFDWPDGPTPEARALPGAEREALLRAAGARPVGDSRWTGCVDDPTGNSRAEVTLVRDLNGDGRPEAVIGDAGTFCNGHAGMNSTVLTRDPSGTWRVVYRNQGFVNFLVSRGAHGFPDIEADLPGFCFPYFRWNGAAYEKIAQLNQLGETCAPS